MLSFIFRFGLLINPPYVGAWTPDCAEGGSVINECTSDWIFL